MGQVLLESLSGKQILMFGLTMLLCTITFFVVGGIKGIELLFINYLL